MGRYSSDSGVNCDSKKRDEYSISLDTDKGIDRMTQQDLLTGMQS